MKKSASSKKTPRKYLSWSSFTLFKRSPASWVKVYIYGEKVETEAMRFGTRFAEALEAGGGETGDRDIDFALAFLPRYPKAEYKIEVRTRGVVLHGRLDGCDTKKHVVGEYKTGKTPWDQKRVDQEGQLTWYALLYFLKHGKIPSIELTWYDTENRTVKTFKTVRAMIHILAMAAEARTVWQQIVEVCDKEYKKIA